MFSGWKLKLWLWVYSASVIYYVQALVRFLSLLIFRQKEVVLLHLPAQIDAMMMPLVCHPAIIFIFCLNPDLLVKVFNEMYSRDESSSDLSRKTRRFATLCVQEQLVTASVFLASCCVIAYGVLVILLNDMSHLLINIEPFAFFKSSTIIVALTTLAELWWDTFWCIKTGFLVSFNCLVLSKTESTLTKLLRGLR